MLHILDQAEVDYPVDPAQAKQGATEGHGIRLLYTHALHSLNQARTTLLGNSFPDLWRPIADWKVD